MSLLIDGTVRRGDFTVAADLRIARGEVVALLGPNGAGKSTLLRATAGLSALSTGVIEVDEVVVDDAASGRFVPADRRGLGVVFQDHRLFPHLRVIDNVAFPARARGRSRAVAHREAGQWLERLGLGAYANRRPRALSGGQAQRVALARALAAQPRALLLDEPLAALDVQTRAEVQGELRGHLAEFDGPTLLVTHDPIEAVLLADRIVVLEEGAVVQTGTPAAVTRQPATPYVARLVGMNLLAGKAHAGQVRLAAGGDVLVPGAPEGDVLVAVRPSAITLHLHEPIDSSARNRWSGTVAGLAPLGDRVRVSVVGPPDLQVDVTAHAVAELGLIVGRPIWLSVKATDLEAYPA